jgi:hypothetical protein
MYALWVQANNFQYIQAQKQSLLVCSNRNL